MKTQVQAITRSVRLENGREFNLLDVLIPALKQTITKEGDILFRGQSERLFTSYFACNLGRETEKLLGSDMGLRIDSPYNKHIDRTKEIKGKVIEVDIAVHTRGEDTNNCLGMEIETTNHPKSDDLWKLEEMTKQEGEYHYQHGLYLVLGVKKKAGKVLDERWYKNGSVNADKPVSLLI